MTTAVRKKKRKKLWILWGVLAALAVVVFLALWQRLTVSRFSLTFADLPSSFDGFRIVQITDLHCERFGEEQRDLCDRISSLEPDIIVITGDMLDQDLLDPEPTRELCEAFAGRIPIYAVTGNHDLWVARSDFQKLLDVYEEYGVTVLRGETAEITRNGETIYLHGEDDPAHWGNDTVGYLREHPISVTPVQDAFNILLYHRANAFPALSSLGFDLIIAGHMHGGQVRIPFVGGLVSPTREYFPDYTAGLYTENGTRMIVGRGLGNAVSVPRVFNPPELVLLTLHRG